MTVQYRQQQRKPLRIETYGQATRDPGLRRIDQSLDLIIPEGLRVLEAVARATAWPCCERNRADGFVTP